MKGVKMGNKFFCYINTISIINIDYISASIINE